MLCRRCGKAIRLTDVVALGSERLVACMSCGASDSWRIEADRRTRGQTGWAARAARHGGATGVEGPIPRRRRGD